MFLTLLWMFCFAHKQHFSFAFYSDEVFGSVAGSCSPLDCFAGFRDLWLSRSGPPSLSRDLFAPGSWNIPKVTLCITIRDGQTDPEPPKNILCPGPQQIFLSPKISSLLPEPQAFLRRSLPLQPPHLPCSPGSIAPERKSNCQAKIALKFSGDIF